MENIRLIENFLDNNLEGEKLVAVQRKLENDNDFKGWLWDSSLIGVTMANPFRPNSKWGWQDVNMPATRRSSRNLA